MRLIPALIVLCLGAMSASAAAQGAPNARVCSPANGQKASIAEIASDPKAWMGKCVSVAGVYSDERLYADADAIYGVSNASIGGYVDGRGAMDGFWKGEFAGRVTDCASAQADLDTGLLRSPGISLDDRVLGCVKPEGPFLVFLSPRGLAPTDLTRRLPGAKGADLTPAPKDWPQLAAMQKLANDFTAALRSGDKTTLLALVKSPYAVERLLADETSAIADLRKPGERQMQVFVDRSRGAGPVGAEACYCRMKDCSKTWPIARRDADNQSSRPYACVRIDGSPAGEGYTLDASQDFGGLPEPR